MEKRGSLVGWYAVMVALFSALGFLYFYFEEALMKYFILALFVLTVMLTVLFFYYEFAYHPTVLKRKLSKLERFLADETLDFLKKSYMEAYNLYLKVPEKRKIRFYSRITAAREKVEEQMKQKNKVEELISKAEKATFTELKNIYAEFEKAFQQLTSKSQQHYYHHYFYLKNRVERGK